MASAIDATKPVAGTPTTASVRANFAAAKSEIEALQAQTAQITGMPRQMVFAQAQTYLGPMTSTTFISQGIGASITAKAAASKIIVSATIPVYVGSSGGEVRLSIFRQINGGGYVDMQPSNNGIGLFIQSVNDGGAMVTVNIADVAARSIGDVIDYELRARSLAGNPWYNALRAGEYQTMQLTEV